MSTLTVTEALLRQEQIIERGLGSFLAVGDALMTIRNDRLYLQTHETFAEYCMDRWGFCDSRARQLVVAARAVTNVTAAGLAAPANEGQARELAKVPEPQREQVWRETLERTGGQPTAAAVRKTAASKSAAKPVRESKQATASQPAAPAPRREPKPPTKRAETRPPSPALDDRAERVLEAATGIARILATADPVDVVAAIDPAERGSYAAALERSVAQLDRLLDTMRSAGGAE